MSLALNDYNLVLVNSLRNVALKSSADFNAVKFFADLNYAKTCLVTFAKSGIPELAELAARATEALFNPSKPLGSLPNAMDVEAPSPQALGSGRRFTAAKELMNSLVVDAVGLRSVLFVLKLERCMTSTNLIDLMDPFRKLLTKRVGSVVASSMTRQVHQLLEAQS